MCNILHDNYKKIPESGKGFKLVRDLNDSFISRSPYGIILHNLRIEYSTGDDGWIEWTPRNKRKGVGFCIFLSLKEAKRLSMIWPYLIVEVEYEGGLGKHIEYAMSHAGFEIAIVKRFKFLNS